MLKDDLTRRTLLQDPGFHEYLSSRPEILAEIWVNGDDNDIIMQQEILVDIMKREEFKDAEEVENLKKSIPSHDILVYALINPTIINIIERDRELQESALKDESMQVLLKLNSGIRDRLTSLNGPIHLCSLLREEQVREMLLSLPETKCRMDRVKKGESQREANLSTLHYSKIEMDAFEKDVKRSMYHLGKNINSMHKVVLDRKFKDDNGIDFSSDDLSETATGTLTSSIQQKKEKTTIYFDKIRNKKDKNNNKSNNNLQQSATFFDDNLGVCEVIKNSVKSIGNDTNFRFIDEEINNREDILLQIKKGTNAEKSLENERIKIEKIEKELDENQYEIEAMKEDNKRLKEKSNLLEKIITEKNNEMKEGLLTLIENGQLNFTSSIVESELKIKSLEIDNDKYKQDFYSSKESLNKTIKQNTELTRKLKEFTRQLIVEKGIVSQLTASRVDLENSLNSAIYEKDQYKNELIKFEEKAMKMENHSQEMLSLMEKDALNLKKEYEDAVNQLKDDIRMLMAQVASEKVETEARNCEMIQTRNLFDKAKIDIETVNRKFNIIKAENVSLTEENNNLMMQLEETSQQVCLMKETVEKQKQEKERFSSDKFNLEREIDRLAEELERNKEDIIESSRKLGDARNSSLEFEKLYQTSQNTIINLQAEVRNYKSQFQLLEDEKKCLNNRLNKFLEQNKLLQKDNQRLKQQNATDQQLINSQKEDLSNVNRELKFLNDIQDKMRNELELIQLSFDKEQNLHMSLREQYLLEEKERGQLINKIQNSEQEMLSLEQKIKHEILKNEQLKYENIKISEESKTYLRKLEMCEEVLQKEQNKYKNAIDNLKEDLILDITHVKKDKQNMEDIVKSLREDIVDLKEQIRLKDYDLKLSYQKIAQMENEAKGRKELECQLMQSEIELKDNKLHVDSISEELKSEQEKRLIIIQENDKLRMNIEQMKEGIKLVKEEYTKEVFLLRSDLYELSSNSNEEINQLRDDLQKSKTELNCTEASLLALQEVRETLSSKNTNFNKTIDALKKRLYQEITSRKLAEEHLKILKQHYAIGTQKVKQTSAEDTNNEKISDKSNKIYIEKLENDLQLEKEQNLQLKNKLNTIETSSITQESHIQTIELQLNEILSENNILKRKLETNQNTHRNANINNQDINNYIKLYEKERAVFFQTSQKLADDLELSREQNNEKTKEIIKLEEYIYNLKEKVIHLEKFNRLNDKIPQQKNEQESQLKLDNAHLKYTHSLSVKKNESTIF